MFIVFSSDSAIAREIFSGSISSGSILADLLTSSAATYPTFSQPDNRTLIDKAAAVVLRIFITGLKACSSNQE